MGASQSTSAAAQPLPEGCPMHKQPAMEPSLNNIPTDLSAYTAPTSRLPLERTVSSIPKASSSRSGCPVNHSNSSSATTATQDTADEDKNWVYPSPSQFQAALTRKGKEAPEESVEMMVQIHNFLNEQAWFEVKKWEDPQSVGDGREVELARFEGRPQDLSPKARFHGMLAKLFPNSYSAEPPFDRHDWYIRRPWDGSIHRYVIDYYSCPEDEQGNPVFSLDVRPALDSFGAVQSRMREWARVKAEAFGGIGKEATASSQR